jgi:hypothetical protein
VTSRIVFNAGSLAAIFALVWWRASLFAAAAAVVVAAAVSAAFRLLSR